MLCFGFRLRIMLIARWFFNWFWAALTLNQGLVSFSYGPAREEAGSSEGKGGDTARAAGSQLTKGISQTCWYYAEQQNQGELARAWQPAAQGLDGHWSVVGEQLCITCFVCSFIIIFPSFCVLLSRFYISSWVLLFFLILCLSTWGRQVNDYVVFSCLPG